MFIITFSKFRCHNWPYSSLTHGRKKHTWALLKPLEGTKPREHGLMFLCAGKAFFSQLRRRGIPPRDTCTTFLVKEWKAMRLCEHPAQGSAQAPSWNKHRQETQIQLPFRGRHTHLSTWFYSLAMLNSQRGLEMSPYRFMYKTTPLLHNSMPIPFRFHLDSLDY